MAQFGRSGQSLPRNCSTGELIGPLWIGRLEGLLGLWPAAIFVGFPVYRVESPKSYWGMKSTSPTVGSLLSALIPYLAVVKVISTNEMLPLALTVPMAS